MKVGTKTETETENDIVSGFFQKMFDFFRICWHPKFPDNPTTSRKTVFAYDFTPSAPFRLTKNGTPMVPAAAPVRFLSLCVQCGTKNKKQHENQLLFSIYQQPSQNFKASTDIHYSLRIHLQNFDFIFIMTSGWFTEKTAGLLLQ
jgi:hypothetical protein